MSVTTITMAGVLKALPNPRTYQEDEYRWEGSEPPLVFTRTKRQRGPAGGICWECEFTLELSVNEAANFGLEPQPLWIKDVLLNLNRRLNPPRCKGVDPPKGYDPKTRSLTIVAYFK
jgi:hypothetical protein